MIFFSATSVGNGITAIKNMFVWNPYVLTDNTSLYSLGLDIIEFRILFLSLGALFIVDYLKMKFDVITKLKEQNIVFRWALTFLLIFSIIIFGMYGPGYDATTFIYRGF